MDLINKKQKVRRKILTAPAKNDFAFPIYVQRRSNLGITIICPDMNIARTLPLPHSYESITDFYLELAMTMVEVDQLSINEFIKRDRITQKKHRETLFPRGLKDHLEIDIHKLFFKPPTASKLTNISLRSWQRWAKEKNIKTRVPNKAKIKSHYLIPFSEIEPHLKNEFIENPNLILTYIKKK